MAPQLLQYREKRIPECADMTGRSLRIVIVSFVLPLLLAGCGSKWKNMTNQELAAKHDECLRVNPTAPGMVTACENIRKECARRRSEGNFAC